MFCGNVFLGDNIPFDYCSSHLLSDALVSQGPGITPAMALPTLGHFGDLKWGLAVGAATGGAVRSNVIAKGRSLYSFHFDCRTIKIMLNVNCTDFLEPHT